jgi:hypothetical protein
MSKTTESKVNKFIADLRMGKVGTTVDGGKPPSPEKLHDGPIDFTAPDRTTKPEKFIDYDKVENEGGKPNKVKMGIKHGESRFPAEAKVPNYKKYDDKGNYVKHKLKMKTKPNGNSASTAAVVRRSLLSNPVKGKKKY